jgi:hypothetical protein
LLRGLVVLSGAHSFVLSRSRLGMVMPQWCHHGRALGPPVGARGPHRQPATDQTASSGGATGAVRCRLPRRPIVPLPPTAARSLPAVASQAIGFAENLDRRPLATDRRLSRTTGQSRNRGFTGSATCPLGSSALFRPPFQWARQADRPVHAAGRCRLVRTAGTCAGLPPHRGSRDLSGWPHGLRSGREPRGGGTRGHSWRAQCERPGGTPATETDW